MSLTNYWPSLEKISECIRTEAEELAEHTLLAVHEPMQLLRKGPDEGVFTEQDLLNHFLSVERPIPIIGRSGVGKSHLIRWLDAQLRIRSESNAWHIVRIPKNASLRQVLELLLDNLDGDEFKQARSKIHTVGQRLNTLEVAELLLVFMGQQLRKKYTEAVEAQQRYKESGTRPEPEELQRLKVIMMHASDDNGLPALLNDSNFRTNLLKPTHSIYQFASRLTKGASDDELSENEYRIHAKDLDFSFNLADLSLNARQYVTNARLNTQESAREEAANVLNEVLGESTRTAFQQLFQFNGGSFQDLFKNIRRHLKDRTLVVLVEDMAAISAIEDVLIDSLLEEGLRDGEQELCPLRSVIAVTDGYPGYIRRQGTIKTRARYEWWIQEKVGNDEETSKRIVDFCSRYLNAARHGSDALSKIWLKRNADNWPPIWYDENADRQHLDAFGIASTGIPLYPFNKAAINALSERYFRDANNNLQFNPREVLNQILLQVLRDCRNDFENNKFPPVDLAGIKAPPTLRGNIHTLGLSEPLRAESLAAIWGFGSKTFEALKVKLSADIARSFNLNDLAGHLTSGVVIVDEPVKEKDGEKPVSPTVEDPDLIALDKISTMVDLWFQKKEELPQSKANILRQKLEEVYQTYAKNEWIGLGELPTLKSGIRFNIYIPNAMGNPVAREISFCNEKEFSNSKSSLGLQMIALALFRYDYFNTKDSSIGWNYPKGFDDFTQYQNFASEWVPSILQTLTSQVRSKLPEKIEMQIQSAWALGIFRESDTHSERMNKLLYKSEDIIGRFQKPLSQVVKEVWDYHIAQWDKLRTNWLDLASSNEHGLQGDIVITALKQALKTEPHRSINKTRELEAELSSKLQMIQMLSDCENTDDFNTVMQEFINVLRELQKLGDYPLIDGLLSSRTMVERINVLTGGTSPWSHAKNLMLLADSNDVIKQWQIINQIDGEVILNLVTILENWKRIFTNTLPKLTNQNDAWGADQLTETTDRIDKVFAKLSSNVSKILEASNEHP